MAATEDKGFTVNDRRFFSQTEEEKERLRKETRKTPEAPASSPESEPETRTGPLPAITFASFIISLSSTAFMHLGDIPEPTTGKEKKDLPLAKQTIDLLGLLREKTRNNLSTEEENLFDHILFDLRMRYVKETTRPGG